MLKHYHILKLILSLKLIGTDIPKYNLAIECDEFNHSNRDPEYEEQRENFIKNELNCEFIRFNPDAKNFSTYDVIGDVLKYIEKLKDDELNKLKIEIDNLTEQLGDFLFTNEDETGPDNL